MDRLERLKSNFFKYLAIPSQSDAACPAVPSSPGQAALAAVLAEDLRRLGLEEVGVDGHAVVYGLLKGNAAAPAMGFVSHLDTVDVGLSPEIHPQILRYEGGDVILNAQKGLRILRGEHPELDAYLNEEIIFSDGTSVLGADNKAAMANIITALEILRETPDLRHGDIYVAFVPDEEIGLRGSKLMDLRRFCPEFAYTIDSCALGEIVYQTFNAGSGLLQITGVTAHPMSAKGVLVNPLLAAVDFINMFDRAQTPERTDGLDGFWWFSGIKSDALNCVLEISIRDHDRERYSLRKRELEDNAARLRALYPRARVELTLTDVYENISNSAGPADRPIALLFTAFEELGIAPKVYAMRGGTDGSALSARGIVTPNYFTGAHNFHSPAEFLPLSSFLKSLEVTLKLIELNAGGCPAVPPRG